LGQAGGKRRKKSHNCSFPLNSRRSANKKRKEKGIKIKIDIRYVKSAETVVSGAMLSLLLLEVGI
jgi:hypothetical protein